MAKINNAAESDRGTPPEKLQCVWFSNTHPYRQGRRPKLDKLSFGTSRAIHKTAVKRSSLWSASSNAPKARITRSSFRYRNGNVALKIRLTTSSRLPAKQAFRLSRTSELANVNDHKIRRLSILVRYNSRDRVSWMRPADVIKMDRSMLAGHYHK